MRIWVDWKNSGGGGTNGYDVVDGRLISEREPNPERASELTDGRG